MLAVALAARTLAVALAHRLRYGAPSRTVDFNACYQIGCKCGGSALVFPGAVTLFWRSCPTLRMYREMNIALRTPPRAIVIRR